MAQHDVTVCVLPDRGYQTYLEQQTRASSQYAKRGYGCSPERRKRSRESPDQGERRAKKYRAFSDRSGECGGRCWCGEADLGVF